MFWYLYTPTRKRRNCKGSAWHCYSHLVKGLYQTGNIFLYLCSDKHGLPLLGFLKLSIWRVCLGLKLLILVFQVLDNNLQGKAINISYRKRETSKKISMNDVTLHLSFPLQLTLLTVPCLVPYESTSHKRSSCHLDLSRIFRKRNIHLNHTLCLHIVDLFFLLEFHSIFAKLVLFFPLHFFPFNWLF